jgi:hypothetical protein
MKAEAIALNPPRLHLIRPAGGMTDQSVNAQIGLSESRAFALLFRQ